ncbi:E3 ubiquitin-protein ligase PRT1 [Raphanus sativus]|nr:E3 ubiquitin-protein ligase PRT1 [Raphanus sativus]
MEDVTMKNADLHEEISDKFLCCVCLELLYKPIVLSCGHLSCFWCVHKSMNELRESHCPICRDPYVHFPAVCQKLHFLLKKIYPLAHHKREEQVLKEEQELECFSPQIDEPKPKEASVSSGDEQKVEKCSNNAGSLLSSEEPRDAKALDENNKQISKDDLLCLACKELLVRPVVLNCGHVYCEGCVVDMFQEGEKIKCQECHISDPRGFPKVCLVLEQLLEENFPQEYNSRRSGIQKSIPQTSKGNSQSSHKEGPSVSGENNNDLPWWANPASNVHIGAGCDCCGVYPIIGERYRCKDCKEEIGYDLCKDCYETPSKVPGRFNQQHTPDHRLELAQVPQFLVNIESIGFLLGPMVSEGVSGEENSDDDDDDDSEEEDVPPPDSNEVSSSAD